MLDIMHASSSYAVGRLLRAVGDDVAEENMGQQGRGYQLGRTRCGVSETTQVWVCSPVHTPNELVCLNQ